MQMRWCWESIFLHGLWPARLGTRCCVQMCPALRQTLCYSISTVIGYHIYRDPLSHVSLRGTVMRKLIAFVNQAMAVAQLTNLHLSVPSSGMTSTPNRLCYAPVRKPQRSPAAVSFDPNMSHIPLGWWGPFLRISYNFVWGSPFRSPTVTCQTKAWRQLRSHRWLIFCSHLIVTRLIVGSVVVAASFSDTGTTGLCFNRTAGIVAGPAGNGRYDVSGLFFSATASVAV